VAELAEAKSIVFSALGQGSHGIINLDNSYLKERFDKLSCAKIVVTQNPQQHDMKFYLSKADYACIFEDGNFVWVEANSKNVILP
ncbi:Mur ligase, partial [Francisella tularensis subsp. holarctica]|nr:Mur ligase [Francisella tularensis subsp. holarctica]